MSIMNIDTSKIDTSKIDTSKIPGSGAFPPLHPTIGAIVQPKPPAPPGATASIKDKINPTKNLVNCAIKKFCNVFNNNEHKIKEKVYNKLHELIERQITSKNIDIKSIVKFDLTNIIFDILNTNNNNYNYIFQHLFVSTILKNNVNIQKFLNDEINSVSPGFLNLNSNENQIFDKLIIFIQKDFIEFESQKPIKGGFELIELLKLYEPKKSQQNMSYKIKQIFKKNIENIFTTDNFKLLELLKKVVDCKVSNIINEQLGDGSNDSLKRDTTSNLIYYILYFILNDSKNVVRNTLMKGIKNAINKKNENNDNNNIPLIEEVFEKKFTKKNIIDGKIMIKDNSAPNSNQDEACSKSKAPLFSKSTQSIKVCDIKGNDIDVINNYFTTNNSQLDGALHESIDTILKNIITDKIDIKNIIGNQLKILVHEILGTEDYKNKINLILIKQIIENYPNKNVFMNIKNENKNKKEILTLFIEDILFILTDEKNKILIMENTDFFKEKNIVKGGGVQTPEEKVNNKLEAHFIKSYGVSNLEYTFKTIIEENVENNVLDKKLKNKFINLINKELKICIPSQISLFINDSNDKKNKNNIMFILLYYLFFSLTEIKSIQRIFYTGIERTGDYFNNIIQEFQQEIDKLDVKIDGKINEERIIEEKIKIKKDKKIENIVNAKLQQQQKGGNKKSRNRKNIKNHSIIKTKKLKNYFLF